MRACSYPDFLKVLEHSTRNLPGELIILATKNIECRVAFFVYLLLLDLAMQPNVEAHTVCIAQREVSDYLKVSLRTIKRAIAFLKRNGYIMVVREAPAKGGYQLNKIQILFPEPFVRAILPAMSSDTQSIVEPLSTSPTFYPISLIEEENLHV